MTRTILLGALALGLTAQGGLALDAGRDRQGAEAPATVGPDQAGRQGRQELEALMRRQRSDRATTFPVDDKIPSIPSKASDRREIRTMDRKIPTICRGC